MKCLRCGNQDPSYFGQIKGEYYCRKCIKYPRNRKSSKTYQLLKNKVEYRLSYQLTTAQSVIADKLLSRCKKGLNTTIKAVCGAGKTEIIYPSIQYCLNNGLRVCYCTPRKALVQEIGQRIKEQFLNLDFGMVYGNHCQGLEQQFILCTVHQLYRFKACFDLLILDESDAFPYCNDETLRRILFQSIRGNYIIMSATLENKPDLFLKHRFHGYPIPMPKVKVLPLCLQLVYLIKQAKRYQKMKLPFLIFVPSCKQTGFLTKFLSYFKIRVESVSSRVSNLFARVELLRKRQIAGLVTTTLLERGITISNIQVMVYQGEEAVFSWPTLVQICGRVGRKADCPDGDIIFLTTRYTKDIRRCLKIIKKDNA